MKFYCRDIVSVVLSSAMIFIFITHFSSTSRFTSNYSSRVVTSLPTIDLREFRRREIPHLQEREEVAGVTHPPCKPGGWETALHPQHPDPWQEMKKSVPPAQCLVKGKWPIEVLDWRNNFRRLYTLHFSEDVEDKEHLLPWLLASHDMSLHTRKRRIYLDLGANRFRTSVYWFLRNYPMDFTEVHAWEVRDQLFIIPTDGQEVVVGEPDKRSMVVYQDRTQWDIPNWMLERIQFHQHYVANDDDINKNAVDITRFIKEELKVTEDDALIVKMDIEEAEWPILTRWLHDKDMADIVDELFVEIHYNHPTMSGFRWDQFTHSREEAISLLVKLRDAGFFVHAWP